MFPLAWVALNWLDGPFTKELNGWMEFSVPLGSVGGSAEGMMNCPLDVLAWRIAKATGSTWFAVMQLAPEQLFAAFTRVARSAASRLLSVRPGRVGTPLNAPLRASLILCP